MLTCASNTTNKSKSTSAYRPSDNAASMTLVPTWLPRPVDDKVHGEVGAQLVRRDAILSSTAKDPDATGTQKEQQNKKQGGSSSKGAGYAATTIRVLKPLYYASLWLTNLTGSAAVPTPQSTGGDPLTRVRRNPFQFDRTRGNRERKRGPCKQRR